MGEKNAEEPAFCVKSRIPRTLSGKNSRMAGGVSGLIDGSTLRVMQKHIGVFGEGFGRVFLQKHPPRMLFEDRSRTVACFAAGELVHGDSEDDHHADHN